MSDSQKTAAGELPPQASGPVGIPVRHSHPAPRPFRALLLYVSALFLFSCLDTTTKYLAMHYNVPLVMAIRFIINLVLMVAILGPTYGRQFIPTQRTGLVLFRAGGLTLASLTYGLALQRMPVAETTAINFLAPMLVVLMAGPALHERIGLLGWSAAVTGFVGVLIIVRPGAGLEAIGVFWVLCAGMANSVYQLLSRMLASTERTMALLFYTVLVGALCFGAGLPWYLTGDPPTVVDVMLFVAIGVLSGVSHLLFTAAYRYAPASLLAPATYLQMLLAGLLGWLAFGHVPDALSILGICVVAASGVMITFKARASRAPSRVTAKRPSGS